MALCALPLLPRCFTAMADSNSSRNSLAFLDQLKGVAKKAAGVGAAEAPYADANASAARRPAAALSSWQVAVSEPRPTAMAATLGQSTRLERTFVVDQLSWTPGSHIFSPLAPIVLLHSSEYICGDTAIERIVPAAQDIDIVSRVSHFK